MQTARRLRIRNINETGTGHTAFYFSALRSQFNQPDHVETVFWSYLQGLAVADRMIQVIVKTTVVPPQRRIFFFYYFPVDFSVQQPINIFCLQPPAGGCWQNTHSEQRLLRIFAIFYK